MAYLTWDEKFSVGVKTIDDQHKQLVDLINELHDAMSMGKGKDVLQKVLQSLIDYTLSHFATEERFMSQNKYQAYDVHKSEHKKFVEKVSDFQKGYNEGRLALSVEIMSFLKDWLIKHILDIDKKMGSFLQEQGAK